MDIIQSQYLALIKKLFRDNIIPGQETRFPYSISHNAILHYSGMKPT